MKAASRPRVRGDQERLLVIDPAANSFSDFRIDDLPQFFAPGDALVLNDAATLPASLRAGPELELRLMSQLDDGSWLSLCLGSGDYRTPTEARGAPPLLAVGTVLTFGHGLSARVRALDPTASRLICIEFEQRGARLWQALYRAAAPIQYSHLAAPLRLWDVQNAYAARPWAVELPSAGKPLRFEVLFRIADRGVTLAHVTHAAGLSSTGSAQLDQLLPVSERYELSQESAVRLRAVREGGGRVIAVGTSVTRALEAASMSGALRAGTERTDLRLGPGAALRICDGLLTGLHEPGTSHFALLEAYASRTLLDRALLHAQRQGYLQHEFGDSCLILKGSHLVSKVKPRLPELRQAS
ncbi:MAG TPA: S-adenosylmethionine:tRNA ribosyltransferase-isomerase [Polyangiaceae bacterium]|nr:S-adenosylmethionine:tRNA ribosyltransferase-isomerase [Polyangiaceae bacterium]